MQSDHVKTTLIAVWMLAVGAVGYVSGTTSFAAWTALVLLSFGPAAVMAGFWSAPAPTMSETIQKVLR